MFASRANTWLETCAMGRYHGMTDAPRVDDRQLIDIEDRPLRRLGAAPYNGPPRPF